MRANTFYFAFNGYASNMEQPAERYSSIVKVECVYESKKSCCGCGETSMWGPPTFDKYMPWPKDKCWLCEDCVRVLSLKFNMGWSPCTFAKFSYEDPWNAKDAQAVMESALNQCHYACLACPTMMKEYVAVCRDELEARCNIKKLYCKEIRRISEGDKLWDLMQDYQERLRKRAR